MSLASVHSKLQSLARRSLQAQNLRSMTVLSKKSGVEHKKQNYTDRMKRTGRPVSPHVTIYAFPIAAISSITNRVTGVALSFGAVGIGALDLFGGAGTSLDLLQAIGSSGFLVAAPAKFVVSFPIAYHYLGGLRHSVWDVMPEYLNNVDTAQSSYALFGASVGLSAIAMFI